MDLKGLLGNYEAAKTELEDAKRKPEILREKILSANRRLSELESAIDAARGKKEQAVMSFAVGDVTEVELRTVRSSLENLVNEKAEVEEFLGASEQVTRQLQITISGKLEKLIGCRHELWRVIAAELKNEVTNDMIARVYVIHVAEMLSGAASYFDLLKNLFPIPMPDEVQIIEKGLTKQYGYVE